MIKLTEAALRGDGEEQRINLLNCKEQYYDINKFIVLYTMLTRSCNKFTYMKDREYVDILRKKTFIHVLFVAKLRGMDILV